jgi:uncharacterized protein YacL
MPQFEQPDLKDSAGRLRRIVLSLLIGAACGALGYVIASQLIDTTGPQTVRVASGQMSAAGFVVWVGIMAFIVTFTLALMVQNHLARKAARAERVPSAKLRV